MNKEEKISRIKELKIKAEELKEEVEYYNALQLALKLVLNGSYGALLTEYFILFHPMCGSSITAHGRDVTKTMDKVNEDYWYNMWHTDIELHKKIFIKNVSQIPKNESVSIYSDTDSVFVSFKPAINHCEWRNIFFDNLNKIKSNYVVLWGGENQPKTNNNCLLSTNNLEKFFDYVKQNEDVKIIVDGHWVKNWIFRKYLKETTIESKIKWNWSSETDFIHGIDYYRIDGYFKEKLAEYAEKYGVENKHNFELERISESIINISKKKYIQHIVYEDGIYHDRLSYIYPKGVELVRSSTPMFAREKIVDIVKYLFSHPDTFNIKDLLKLVKNLKKEFDLCVPDRIDEISMQSSCSSYEEKVLEDVNGLKFQVGTHFAVKASAYYNYLLHKNKNLQSKYEFLKSGTKIKYYYVKDKSMNEVFAYMRGSYPIEFAPEIDLDTQFNKCILSPINSIISPLKLPQITQRLTIVMDFLGGNF